MKSPKTLSLKCLCGGGQTVALSPDAYEAVSSDGRQFDFAYFDRCQMPIAFELPLGLLKRHHDRYSVVTIAEPLRRASQATGTDLEVRAAAPLPTGCAVVYPPN